MALITCSGCGKSISDAAAACIHCGMPRAGAPPGVPRTTGSSPVVIVLGIVAVLFGGVMLIGILAAIAIPRFASASRVAKEAEATTALEQVLTLQRGYHAEAGAYASDLEGLLGWTNAPLRYYTVSMTEASDATFCADANPRPDTGQGLSARSIDESGYVYTAAGCVDVEELGEDPLDEPEESGESRSPEASGDRDPEFVKPPKD